MRLYLSILLASLFTSALSADSPAKPARDEVQELVALEGVWNKAHTDGDAAALDKLWDEELVVTVPEMATMSKTASLAFWRTGRMKFERYDTSELKIRVIGSTGIVTGRVERTRALGGRTLRDDWNFTKVYVRRDGQWKVAAWHASNGVPK